MIGSEKMFSFRYKNINYRDNFVNLEKNKIYVLELLAKLLGVTNVKMTKAKLVEACKKRISF
jgi:hypothetical protein